MCGGSAWAKGLVRQLDLWVRTPDVDTCLGNPHLLAPCSADGNVAKAGEISLHLHHLKEIPESLLVHNKNSHKHSQNSHHKNCGFVLRWDWLRDMPLALPAQLSPKRGTSRWGSPVKVSTSRGWTLKIERSNNILCPRASIAHASINSFSIMPLRLPLRLPLLHSKGKLSLSE